MVERWRMSGREGMREKRGQSGSGMENERERGVEKGIKETEH